ncbi:hypothetical protein FC62_GL000326 [Amylolactobacillus amylotrophicus DSM 20534]|uniref:Uncharacterized protein n=3 Tax=Amylolactobacillus TaxID=2767876 RepID=A0A0R1YJM4_9LACO|nr:MULTISPECIES: DUF3397 family protein [Amylolactobacillus]APT19095.1 DUF3397 domain-containing protein [Amylolactobacillus amylophilus DSM 20533 = JCM 1125]KRK38639.1 hypothetical protein FC62_GL000326 [Amylolactobacillus amylotrophicus DSM 20534]KRM42718.1 hypothetical protein FD40_GL000513 [Amylolactobacillus amylophilus DSM 20533 = JCM 1125]GED79580.1 hypothetical protein LAM01_00530 [Amylolactobacillus amylophilus]
MNLFLILLIPLVGIILAGIIMQFTGRTVLKGYDILPLFFLATIEMITNVKEWPTYLPYGFLYFFLFVIGFSVYTTVHDKNISLKKTLISLWRYLIICSFFWLLGLIILLFI